MPAVRDADASDRHIKAATTTSAADWSLDTSAQLSFPHQLRWSAISSMQAGGARDSWRSCCSCWASCWQQQPHMCSRQLRFDRFGSSCKELLALSLHDTFKCCESCRQCCCCCCCCLVASVCHRNPCRRNMRVTTSSRRPSSFLALLALVAVCRQMMAAVACRWQPVSASRMPWRIMQSISTLISSVHSSRFEVSVLASLDRSGSLPMAAAMSNGCCCA